MRINGFCGCGSWDLRQVRKSETGLYLKGGGLETSNLRARVVAAKKRDHYERQQSYRQGHGLAGDFLCDLDSCEIVRKEVRVETICALKLVRTPRSKF